MTVADVSTSLTVSAPASVEKESFFNITGILVRNDTGAPIPNAAIGFKYNGSPLGSATTGVDGDYLTQAKINVQGSFTITAEFAGMNVAGLTLLPSGATRRISTGAAAVNPMLIALGLVAAYLLTSKK